MKKNLFLLNKKFFSYFKKINEKNIYKPLRRINFNDDNFFPIFKIDEQNINTRLNREDYRKLCFLPFLSYNIYFFTNLSITSIFNLLGIPFFCFLSIFFCKLNDQNFFSRIKKLEVKKDFEEIRLTPYFNKNDIKEILVKKENILNIKKIGFLKIKDFQQSCLKIEVLIDGEKKEFILNIRDNEFDGYLDYLEKLAEKKNIDFN